MPEVPNLEGYRAYPNRRLPGLRVETISITIPIVPRDEANRCYLLPSGL